MKKYFIVALLLVTIGITISNSLTRKEEQVYAASKNPTYSKSSVKSSYIAQIYVTPTIYCLGSCPIVSPTPVCPVNGGCNYPTPAPTITNEWHPTPTTPMPNPTHASPNPTQKPSTSPAPTVIPCSTIAPAQTNTSAANGRRMQGGRNGRAYGWHQQFWQYLVDLINRLFQHFGWGRISTPPSLPPCKPSPTPTPKATSTLSPVPSCPVTSAVKAASTPQNYYASPTGNDSNPGTLASPWKTINASVNKLSAGDTLYLRGGTWPGENAMMSRGGAAGSPITITNYNGELAILDGSGVGGSAIYMGGSGTNYAASYITFRGFTIRNYGVGLYTRESGNIIIDNMDIYNMGTTIDFTDTKDSSITNSKLHNTSWNNVALDEYVKQMSNITISGNSIYDSPGTTGGEGHAGIDLQEESSAMGYTNIKILNNQIYNIASNPIFFHESISTNTGHPWTNFTISGNNLYHYGCSAQPHSLHDSTISYNTINNVYSTACGDGMYISRDPDVNGGNGAENNLFLGNTFTNTYGQNLVINTGNSNTFEANALSTLKIAGNNIIKNPASRSFTLIALNGSTQLQTTTGQVFTVNSVNRGSAYTIPGAGTYLIESTAGTGIAAPTAIPTTIPTTVPTIRPTTAAVRSAAPTVTQQVPTPSTPCN